MTGGSLLPTPPPDPWRSRSSRHVYTNPWISVREDQVLRPDGSPGVYGVVSVAPAVGVVATVPFAEVLALVEHGLINDSLTVLGLLAYDRQRR